MVFDIILGALAFLSLAISVWQWLVARRFPLHARIDVGGGTRPVTILKPLRGVDAESRACLESWFSQNYPGPVQILFGVAANSDPVCSVVRELIAAHPQCDARLVICAEMLGMNGKVSTLAQLQRHSQHDVVVVSDSDVQVPPDFLANVSAPLNEPSVGLVNCFYRLANPTTLAMRWEAIAINADFWSQVLQAKSLRPLDFALGAALATTRPWLDRIGGFASLVDCLADDYQLGNRIAGQGGEIVISPMVVDCREAPKNWKKVWKHQMRWARTIRFCRPIPYFFSILGNSTFWPALWLLAELHTLGAAVTGLPGGSTPRGFPMFVTGSFVAFLTVRVWIAVNLQSRLAQSTLSHASFWLVPVKDLLNAAVWAFSFLGNHVEWRGQCYEILPGGKLKLAGNQQNDRRAL